MAASWSGEVGLGANRWHVVGRLLMETMMTDFVRVAGKSEIAEGACIGVRVKDKEIAVYHLPGGEFRATDNVCSHEYALLSEGWVENGCIECPLHAAQFDIRTGKAMSAPADEDIAVYEVKLEGEDILIALPQ